MNWKKFTFSIISVVLLLLVVEFICFVSLKTFYPISSREEASFNKDGGCIDVFSSARLDFLYGVVYLKRTDCLHKPVNSQGFMSREWPKQKNSKYYTVLLLGGSVAENLYIYLSKKDESGELVSAFETYLNEKYISKTGKPIRLISGARVDFRQPQQFVIASQLVKVVDSVVSLEGYNDNHAIGSLRNNPPPPYEWSVLANKERYTGLFKLREFFRGSRFIQTFNTTKMFFKMLIDFTNLQMAQEYNFHDYPSHVATEAQAIAWYQSNISNLGYLCEGNKLDCVIYFQPTPQLYKNLTPEEEKVVRENSGPEYANFGKVYKKVVDSITSKKYRGLGITSLLKIFQPYKKQIYWDNIHVREDDPDVENSGNYIFMRAIAKDLLKRGIIFDKS